MTIEDVLIRLLASKDIFTEFSDSVVLLSDYKCHTQAGSCSSAASEQIYARPEQGQSSLVPISLISVFLTALAYLVL